MNNPVFSLKHIESGTIAFVEFSKCKGKLKTNIGFSGGNVVSLKLFKAAKDRANEILCCDP